MNIKSRNISIAEYTDILETLLNGCAWFRPNIRVASVLAMMATTGYSLTDVLQIKNISVKQDGESIVVFANDGIYKPRPYELSILSKYIEKYRDDGSENGDRFFTVGRRCVEKFLKNACDYLGYIDVSSHSFKKIHNFFLEYEMAVPKLEPSKPRKNTDISGVYSICCKRNGRVYIGESEDITQRWSEHLESLKKGNHHSKALQADYNKYGSDGFEFKVLGLYTKPSERKAAESNFISALRTIQYGYNTRA